MKSTAQIIGGTLRAAYNRLSVIPGKTSLPVNLELEPERLGLGEVGRDFTGVKDARDLLPFGDPDVRESDFIDGKLLTNFVARKFGSHRDVLRVVRKE